MDHLKTAMKFGEWVSTQYAALDISDAMLYGSVARNEINPHDIDILVIHTNPILDEIQKLRGKDNTTNDFERFGLLKTKLETSGYPAPTGLVEIPECRDALAKGLLNIIYLNKSFFTDETYRTNAIKANENPFFYNNIFIDGLLWNTKEGAFSIPAVHKYVQPK